RSDGSPLVRHRDALAAGGPGLRPRARLIGQNGPGRAKMRPFLGVFWTLGAFAPRNRAECRVAWFVIMPPPDGRRRGDEACTGSASSAAATDPGYRRREPER